jgi:DNA-binding response OmpR family regulator
VNGSRTVAMEPHVAKILIVESDIEIYRLLAQLVKAIGHSALAAHSTAEALALVERERPDLVILDLEIGPGERAEIVRQLQDRCSALQTPIVALSTWLLASELWPARAVGCTAVFPKPFDMDRLIAAIEACLVRSPAPGLPRLQSRHYSAPMRA